jgi:hypothetical protein
MAKHRAFCPKLVTVAAGLVALLGCSVIVEVALWDVSYSLAWQLIAAVCAGRAALALHDGRRWALVAALLVVAGSPVAALAAARELGMVASAPYVLALAILGFLVPRRSRRWFRKTRVGRQVTNHARRGVRTPVVVALRQ